MATQTKRIWQQQLINSSGIRRLKIVDTRTVQLIHSFNIKNKVTLVPKGDVTMYEFIFSSDLNCIATASLSKKESGSAFWVQNISFTLPHNQNEVIQWVVEHAQVQWLVISEDHHGIVRVFGGVPNGLDFSFAASSGANPKDNNPQSFTFSGESLQPYLNISSYEDSVLFSSESAYTYGFSLAFES